MKFRWAIQVLHDPYKSLSTDQHGYLVRMHYLIVSVWQVQMGRLLPRIQWPDQIIVQEVLEV